MVSSHILSVKKEEAAGQDTGDWKKGERTKKYPRQMAARGYVRI
jgi:hypothetical protein